MEKIRKGDEVVILTGRDKKRRGTVLSRVDADHLLIEGINVVKKHVRPNPMQGTSGGIIEKNMPIHISNVALVCPTCGVAKVGFKGEGGKRYRVCKKCGNALPAKKN